MIRIVLRFKTANKKGSSNLTKVEQAAVLSGIPFLLHFTKAYRPTLIYFYISSNLLSSVEYLNPIWQT